MHPQTQTLNTHKNALALHMHPCMTIANINTCMSALENTRSLTFDLPLSLGTGEEGSGSGGGDGGDRYSDEPGSGPPAPPYSKPARNPPSQNKPPRVRDRTGTKWTRPNHGHGNRIASGVNQLPASHSITVFFLLAICAAPMW